MANILCVEDEADIQADILEELTDAGHTTSTASTGVEALQAIAGDRFDLILCDNLMPAMTGLELLRRIRGNHPELAHVPFVILSAHADRTHVEQGLEQGADAYLTKPVDFEDLVETVERLLADGRRVPEPDDADGHPPSPNRD